MLAEKTALVTGGGRGIGRAIAIRLAKEGARVVVTGRTLPEIEAVAAEVGGRAIRADLGDRESVRALLHTVTTEESVDVLVNNAGVSDSAPLAKTTDEMWDRTLEINVTSAFALCRGIVPGMVARGFGRVINVASNAGRAGYAYTSAYCASKHAMVGLTRALAAELAKTAVTVNAVCPGWVRSDMSAQAIDRIAQKTRRTPEEAEAELAAMSPQRRLLEPDEVAHLVATLVAPSARGVNGQSIVIDGGQLMT